MASTAAFGRTQALISNPPVFENPTETIVQRIGGPASPPPPEQRGPDEEEKQRSTAVEGEGGEKKDEPYYENVGYGKDGDSPNWRLADETNAWY